MIKLDFVMDLILNTLRNLFQISVFTFERITKNNGVIELTLKEEEHEEKDSHYKKSEFRYGEFSRTVYFPKDIDVEKTTAKLEHGILKINAPKKEVEKESIKKLTVK